MKVKAGWLACGWGERVCDDSRTSRRTSRDASGAYFCIFAKDARLPLPHHPRNLSHDSQHCCQLSGGVHVCPSFPFSASLCFCPLLLLLCLAIHTASGCHIPHQHTVSHSILSGIYMRYMYPCPSSAFWKRTQMHLYIVYTSGG
ncbi:unnamed protein product [Ectocarpus sp. 8 AP-2014]